MSVWLPTAPCTPRTCAGHTGPVRGRLPATALLLAGCSLVLAGVVCVPVVMLLGRAPRDRLIRWWAYGVVRAFGVRVRVTGRPQSPEGAAHTGTLVVANHVSWLDIPLVAAVLPGRMLAKSEIRRWPVVGPLAALGGTLFVERDRLRALPTTVRDIAGALRGGSRVVVFPEGSTWCGRGPGGRFRPAVFQAAIDTEAEVRPVRIAYRTARTDGQAAGAAAFVGDDPLAASLWRVVTAAGLTAEIGVLPPIPAGTLPGRRALARAAQTAVASDSANRSAESVHH
ncbi:lysophospholipid acyltransferase family protein [Streptomyces sp. NBC_00316]|uniref:lysophospholipid acyltransferase family protein n=1 Tax=Streptomyces sp. NBC_00316 TaxID=2975710 RepID=UPI002E289D45|nr:lysophospholipid acyltransferase family protein [Streptomyces sp. NBC_00316]